MATADEQILQLIITRQESIFNKLEEMDETLKTVAVQKNELDHLGTDMTEVKQRLTKIETACLINHPRKKGLGDAVARTAILTAVSIGTTLVMSFCGYLVVKNITGFIQQDQKTLSSVRK